MICVSLGILSSTYTYSFIIFFNIIGGVSMSQIPYEQLVGTAVLQYRLIPSVATV